MRVKSEQEEKTFALTADVSEVHREVSIAQKTGTCSPFKCRKDPRSSSKVGTFRMSSASYYSSWSFRCVSQNIERALGTCSQLDDFHHFLARKTVGEESQFKSSQVKNEKKKPNIGSHFLNNFMHRRRFSTHTRKWAPLQATRQKPSTPCMRGSLSTRSTMLLLPSPCRTLSLTAL